MGLLDNLLDISDNERYEWKDSDDGIETKVDRHRYQSSRSLDDSIDTISEDVRNATINQIFDRVSLLWDLGLLTDKTYAIVSLAIYELLNNIDNWGVSKSQRFIEFTMGCIPNRTGEFKSLTDSSVWEGLLALRNKKIADFTLQTN